MRRIFSEWFKDERAFVVAPLALWILALIVWSLVTMVRTRRLRGPGAGLRNMGIGWKLSFAAAVVWLVGWSVWLTVADTTADG